MSEANATHNGQNSRKTKRRIAPLLARRRQNLDRDGHIERERVAYERDGDGHKIGQVIRPKKGGEGTTTVDIDLTALEGAAPSTTSSMRIIELEAEIAADEPERIKNPHIPTTDDVLRAALDHLRPMGLEPAWEVVDE